MSGSMSLSLAIRSYSAFGDPQTHDFSQLVLPLAGSLEIDISGRGALLDRSLAAYVESRAPHSRDPWQIGSSSWTFIRPTSSRGSPTDWRRVPFCN